MGNDVTFDKGLILRKSRHLYGPGELLDATNVLPDELAALATRPGAEAVGTVLPTPIHSLHAMWKADGVKVRYQAYTHLGAVFLIRDFSTIIAAGPANEGGPVDFVSAKGHNEEKTYTYFANGSGAFRVKDDGTATSKWGIDPPIAQPIAASLGGGGLIEAGNRFVTYIYVRKSGATVLHQGNPGLPSAMVTTIANDSLLVAGLHNPADPLSQTYDPQVTHVWIFRTTIDIPEVFQFDTEIAATGIGPLQVILTQRDDTLGEILEQDNSRPPGLWSIALHYDHLIGVSGTDNILYVSKRFRLESFPVQNQIEVSSPGEILLMVRSYAGRAIVHTTSRVFEIVGGTDEQQWTAVESNAPTGLDRHCRHSVARGLRGVYWKGYDGIYRWDGSQINNITDDRLWPIFHKETVNGYLPVVTSPALPQAGGWAENRYYWAYSTDGVTMNRMLVYDELTDSWWSDTRGFERFHFEQRDNLFLGSYRDGRVYVLNDRTNTTDAGIPIGWSLQTRDDDEGAPTSDKELDQVTVEMDSQGVSVTVQVVRNYGVVGNISLFTGATSGRTQVAISTMTAAFGVQPTAKALGYRFAGFGPFKLYRLFPIMTTLPMTRRAFHFQASDLGYRGAKQLTHFRLDADLLSAGTLTAVVKGDGVVLGTLQRTTTGRIPPTSVYELGDATLIEVNMESTADFRLWSAEFGIIGLPVTRREFLTQPSSLGYRGEKQITHLTLDAELLSPGTLTASVFGDNGAVIGTLQRTALGRGLQSIYELGEATLIQVLIHETVDFRLWSAEIGTIALPVMRRIFRMQPSSFGYHGIKYLTRLRLDVDIPTAGTVVATVLGDGVVMDTMTLTGPGRFPQSLLESGGAADLVELRLESVVDFRLWYADIAFLTLPEEGYLYHMIASDLGWPSVKIGSWLDIDYELMEPGVLNVNLAVDNVSRYTTEVSAIGRHRTGRLRLPRVVSGRLIALNLTSTGRFRFWGGEIAFMRLGQKEGVQRVSLRDAASPGGKIEVLQATPSQEVRVESLHAAPAQDVRIIDVGRQVA